MDKKKRAAVRRYLTLAAVVLLTAGLAAMPLLTAGSAPEEKQASILTGTVVSGSLNRTLPGGGTLTVPDSVEVTIPEGVEITEFLIASGDVVEEGQPIARVDRVSVMTAVKDIQDSIDAVAEKMRKLSSKITVGVITVDESGNVCTNGKVIPTDKLADYAEYFSMAEQHRTYTEILLDLFRLHQSGTVLAPADGMVNAPNTAVVKNTSFEGEARIVWLAVNTPIEGDDEHEDNDEDDGITYECEVGVVNSLSEDGSVWNMLMSKLPTPSLTDFTDTNNFNTDVSFMKTPKEYSVSTPVFFWNGSSWETVEAKAGDILLFAHGKEEDGTGVEWVLKIGSTQTPDTPDPSKPGTQFPGGLENLPNTDGQATIPGFPDTSALIGGYGNYGAPQQEETLHGTATVFVCTLIPQEVVRFTIAVDEEDIREITPGMTASVTLEALPGKVFSAEVVEVSKFGSGNGGSSKYAVELEMAYEEGMLPGMNAAAILTLETLDDVLMIPTAAIAEENGQTIVYTGYDEKSGTLTNPVEVEIGLSDGENVQILSGLAEGTTFWYSYYDTLEISTTAKSSRFG